MKILFIIRRTWKRKLIFCYFIVWKSFSNNNIRFVVCSKKKKKFSIAKVMTSWKLLILKRVFFLFFFHLYLKANIEQLRQFPLSKYITGSSLNRIKPNLDILFYFLSSSHFLFAFSFYILIYFSLPIKRLQEPNRWCNALNSAEKLIENAR